MTKNVLLLYFSWNFSNSIFVISKKREKIYISVPVFFKILLQSLKKMSNWNERWRKWRRRRYLGKLIRYPIPIRNFQDKMKMTDKKRKWKFWKDGLHIESDIGERFEFSIQAPLSQNHNFSFNPKKPMKKNIKDTLPYQSWSWKTTLKTIVTQYDQTNKEINVDDFFCKILGFSMQMDKNYIKS